MSSNDKRSEAHRLAMDALTYESGALTTEERKTLARAYLDLERRLALSHVAPLGGMVGKDMDAPELPCCGCGQPLLIENAWMEDGCPCNTPAGVNNLNLYRWRLLHELQQRQSRELAEAKAAFQQEADIRTDRENVMDAMGKALGVAHEPHQSYMERLVEAASAITPSSTAAEPELLAIHEAVMNPEAVQINDSDSLTVRRVKEFVQRAFTASSTAAMSRGQFNEAFVAAIDMQANFVPHQPGWKPLIDFVWEELEARGLLRSATSTIPLDIIETAKHWADRSTEMDGHGSVMDLYKLARWIVRNSTESGVKE